MPTLHTGPSRSRYIYIYSLPDNPSLLSPASPSPHVLFRAHLSQIPLCFTTFSEPLPQPEDVSASGCILTCFSQGSLNTQNPKAISSSPSCNEQSKVSQSRVASRPHKKGLFEPGTPRCCLQQFGASLSLQVWLPCHPWRTNTSHSCCLRLKSCFSVFSSFGDWLKDQTYCKRCSPTISSCSLQTTTKGNLRPEKDLAYEFRDWILTSCWH